MAHLVLLKPYYLLVSPKSQQTVIIFIHRSVSNVIGCVMDSTTASTNQMRRQKFAKQPNVTEINVFSVIMGNVFPNGGLVMK